MESAPVTAAFVEAGLPTRADLLGLSAGADPVVIVASLETGGTPEDLLEACRRTLDRAHRQAAARYLCGESRRDFILAHWLTNRLLAPLGGWRGVDSPPGRKPRLRGSRTLDFNLTHTRGLVACAVGRGAMVGIDAEIVRQRSWEAAQRYSLAPAERRWVAGRPAAAECRSFLGIWTIKEAVAKCFGLGLALDFRRLSVALDPPRLTQVPSELGSGSDWTVMQWEPDSSHVVALALRGGGGAPPPVRIWHGRLGEASPAARPEPAGRHPAASASSPQRCPR